ncbi:MAG: DNA-directed RNA polymerase subunit omega [Alphaproteobacteria bacterium]|jgi:DNA-directed RNA polymerase subunit omega|nr:DNA-directed RNA polymerase subunit omega [Alphaproteobacteria bacterium]
MARVTVEDCVVRVPNRFELAILAAQRSRELTAGANLTIERDNDKNPVVALREIADGTVAVDQLRDSVVRGHQRHLEAEEAEEDVIELMAGEEEALSQPPGHVAPDSPDSPQSDEISLDALREDGEDTGDPETEGFAPDTFEEELGAEDELGAEGLGAEEDEEEVGEDLDELGEEGLAEADLSNDVTGEELAPLPEAEDAEDPFSR